MLELLPISPKQKKNPRTAAALSLCLGGLGQIYLGQTSKGICIILIGIVGVLTIVSTPLVIIVGMIDAYLLAKKLERGEAIRAWEFFWMENQEKNEWSISKVLTTDRAEEFIGEEYRLIDNSGSSGNLKRTITVSKEWSQSYTVGYENAQSSTMTAGIGDIKMGKLFNASIKTVTENIVKSNYSLSAEKKQEYREDITIEVPGYKKTRVSFRWKHILQHGIVSLSDHYGEEIHVPFQVVIGITFDQTQVDEI
jgi:TM2 domain-containing membrane protein YozV